MKREGETDGKEGNIQTVVLQRSVMVKPTERKANTRKVNPLNTQHTNSKYERNKRSMVPQNVWYTKSESSNEKNL